MGFPRRQLLYHEGGQDRFEASVQAPAINRHERGASIAVVMSGGGAVGAYEAGVMLYALQTLSREKGCSPRFDLFSGTSVGAINASFLAANADDPCYSAERLVEFWKSLTPEKVMRFGSQQLRALARLAFGGRVDPPIPRAVPSRPPAAWHQPVAGLFDTTPLYELLQQTVPWQRLQRNLAGETVRGISLCATEVCAGVSTVFYQTSPNTEYRKDPYPSREVREVTVGVEHTMASAAMPVFFPSVQIDGTCYTDGSIRQNTPLNPALRMGADRVLVISLQQDPTVASNLARAGCRKNAYPGLSFLIGKTVNAMLNQSLDYELHRLELFNKLIEGGSRVYGAGFLENLNRIISGERNASFRPVRTCHIRPSQNPLQLALQAAQSAPDELSFPGLAGKLISATLASTAFTESELFANMLFTPTYIRGLVNLGYADAEASKDALFHLFED